MNAPDPQGDCDLRATYDSYYTTKEYQHRYPTPNIGTLAFLQRHVIGQCTQILDLGCGDGRYAIPILKACDAHLTGCDISAAALQSFRDAAAAQAILEARYELLHHSVEQIDPNKSFDAILMIFGVLSHIKETAERKAVLQKLRRLAKPECKLILSVPSIWRRRPWDLLASALHQGRKSWGDICFNRTIAGKTETFPYHLYSVNTLRLELAQAGWRLVACEAESLFPEWLVTQHKRLGEMDYVAQRLLPASLGYGIRAIALAADGSEAL